MESVLAILCIVFFAVLTYGLVQGNNLTKDHLYNCRTIYIPEEIDLELAYKNVTDKNLDALKKRARELGASKKFVDTFKSGSDKTELQKFIILNSISNEHILFDKINDKHILDLEKMNMQKRINDEVNHIPTPISKKTREYLYYELGIDKGLSDKVVKDKLKTIYLEKTNSKKGFKDPSITIKELRKDAGLDN